MANDYHNQAQMDRTKRLIELVKELPDVCSDYFLAIEQQTSPLTRLSYAYDLKLFFQYLSDEVPRYSGKPDSEFSIEDIRLITKRDLERYARYLTLYIKNESLDDGRIESREITNHEYGIKRKYASLRAFYKYLFADGLIDGNIAALVPLPKLHERAIIRLDIDEVARILDVAESGQSLPKAYQKYHQLTRTRDVAMLSLFLGTGIRISECVGLNIDDFDFEQNAFVVTRKGGNRAVLYFNEEVASALHDYVDIRIKSNLPDENALFLSLQNRRISTRAVQELTKKYAKIISPLKKITPHKLRSTFGTNLYRQTGDIYVVADCLGHKDVNTTKKHYAAITEDVRKKAATTLTLKNDK